MERKAMNDYHIIDIEDVFGDPVNPDLEFYSTMSEEEKEEASEEEPKTEAAPEEPPEETVEAAAEETDAKKSEAEKEEASEEEPKTEVAPEEPPVETVGVSQEGEAGEKAEKAPAEIQMDPEEVAKIAMQTEIVQAAYTDMRNDLPRFRSGDNISVGYRVIEGSRSRVQTFEGVVIKISSGHGLDKTFTVRKISGGIGVERIFPFHSPNIESIKVLKEGKVRRAKLYYLRSRKGKSTRIKERT
jgi:large subunit ribosomal protein L19